ncbi:hypothetical protein L9F63_014320, partial [Diploptera punctata]
IIELITCTTSIGSRIPEGAGVNKSRLYLARKCCVGLICLGDHRWHVNVHFLFPFDTFNLVVYVSQELVNILYNDDSGIATKRCLLKLKWFNLNCILIKFLDEVI